MLRSRRDQKEINKEQRKGTTPTLGEKTVWLGATAELRLTMDQCINAYRICVQSTRNTQIGLCNDMLHKKRKLDRGAAIIVNTF